MSLVALGKSNIKITPIGLGCWQFSEGKGFAGKYWGAVEEQTMIDIVRATLEGGITWFDTAEAYGWGSSEAALARALKALGKADGDVVIATKWMPVFRTARSIIRTIDDRLKNLNGFHIDLHQIHAQYGSFSSLHKQLDAMAQLVREGKIRTIGVSNFSAKAMRKSYEYLAQQNIPLVSNQMEYNLLNRRIESNGVLETARELGITIIAYSPLAQGILSGKFHENPDLIKASKGWRRFRPEFQKRGLAKTAPVIEELKRIASKHNATASQVALRWLIQFHGDTVVAIPGATKVKQAQENASVLHFQLDQEDLMKLDEVSRSFL
ncbi:MAG: aldo/keto reductase [candidate division KSB1 bacterium]|nr:aldo/keto reductase [candidate division KSB1 bacterium]